MLPEGVTAEIDEIPDGHVVLRAILAQIAPAARAATTTTTGFDQTKVGDGILCAVVGEVVVTSPSGPAAGSVERSGATHTVDILGHATQNSGASNPVSHRDALASFSKKRDSD